MRTKPPTGPVRPSPANPAAAAHEESVARQLDDDNDLFGMDELAGGAPPSEQRPQGRASKRAEPGAQDFDVLELDRGPRRAPAANSEPVATQAASSEEPLELADVRASKPKTGPILGAEQTDPRPPTPRPQTKRGTTGPIATSRPPAPEPEGGAGRALVSSALTGLLAAGLAIVILIISALNGGSAGGFFGKAASSDVVATKVVSGLYDTASGKPVFFVRGRIENRGKQVHGPVRVTAELVSDGTAEARAEALAGAEPSAEDVYSVRSATDAEKLTRALESAKVRRKVEPGESIPFFAIIADPPSELVRHRLRLKVESLDAPQSAPHAAKAK